MDDELISRGQGENTNSILPHWYLLDSGNVHGVWFSLKWQLLLLNDSLTSFNGMQIGNVLDCRIL